MLVPHVRHHHLLAAERTEHEAVGAVLIAVQLHQVELSRRETTPEPAAAHTHAHTCTHIHTHTPRSYTASTVSRGHTRRHGKMRSARREEATARLARVYHEGVRVRIESGDTAGRRRKKRGNGKEWGVGVRQLT